MAEATQQTETDDLSQDWNDLANSLVEPDETDDEVVAEAPETPTTGEADGELAPGVDRGDGRDVNGQFAPSKSKTEGDTPVAGEATEPEKTPDEAAPQPTTEAVEAPASVESLKPYTVKVEGQEYAVEGATYSEKGDLLVPAASVPHLTRAVQEGIYKMAHWEQHLEGEREKARTEGKALSDKLMEQIGGFADLLADGFVPVRLQDGTQVLAVSPSAQPVLEFFSTYKAKLPLLMAEQKAAELEAKLAARTQQEQAQTAESFDSQVGQAIEAQIAEWRSHPALKVLTADDWSELQEIVTDTRSAYIVEQDGEKYLDTDKLGKLYEKRAALRTKLAAETKAAQSAAKFNKGQQASGAKAQSQPARRTASKPDTPSAKPKDGREVFEDAFRNWDRLDDDDE